MNKKELYIPKNIEYISQWKDYEIPKREHCIVDKGVTGCGYTEFALTNNDWIVLCSPRKLLLENKSEKHKKEGHENILYLENLSEDSMYIVVKRHLKHCIESEVSPKFLITYDSTGKIIVCLLKLGILDKFTFVVDEFQSIFLDSYFKVGVEFDFVNNLQKCQNVVYLSATPMLDKYLNKLEEFKYLPFYKLNWSNSGFVETITIGRKRTNALTTECAKIVNNYLSGKFPLITDENNSICESKEAVFYFNSVSEILRVIRKCKLTPENTIIVCSKTDKNQEKLKKEGFSFGKIPLENEENPMFTFCTSAVYMGVDFHSNCASSYVFADPNVECLALDISLDLPQIIGRQRNKKNPFKNYITLFYKTKRKDELDLTEENFRLYQEKKKEETQNLLNLFERATENEKKSYIKKLISDIEFSNYSGDFVSISEKTGKPIYNSLIEIADERAWDVSQKDYQDTLSVTKAILDLDSIKTSVIKYIDEDETILNDFLDNHFYKTGLFHEKMKMYCEFSDKYRDNPSIIDGLIHRVEDPLFLKYYRYYGTSGCSARKFRESDLYRGWENASKEDKLNFVIYEKFKSGDKLPMISIKSILKDIYSSLNISRTAKATDLADYFKLSKTQVTTKNGVKNGFKLGERLISIETPSGDS
jgi:hypothetical protein